MGLFNFFKSNKSGEPQYLNFEPLQKLDPFEFQFHSTRVSVWQSGKVIYKNNEQNYFLNTIQRSRDGLSNFNILSINNKKFEYLKSPMEFDITITGTDHIFFITIPEFYSPGSNTSIELFRHVLGSTRREKNFQIYEPYCAKLFLSTKNQILKLSISILTPNILVEFK